MTALRPDAAPDWLVRLTAACATASPDEVPLRRRPGTDAREAAVLMLLADGGDGSTSTAGPDVLLIERAADLRTHAGQAAFPGGGREPGDGEGLEGLVAAALRETAEETGADPAGIVPLAVLPSVTIPVTGFAVTPVLAHWVRPGPVGVLDPGEVASVVRVPLAELTDPARRFAVTGPSGHVSPAFGVRGLLVWGFTALILSWVLDLAGWSEPWDTTDVRDLTEAWDRRHIDEAARHGDDQAARRREGETIR